MIFRGRKRWISLATFIVVGLFFILIIPGLAQTMPDLPESSYVDTNLDLVDLVVRIINYAMGFLGFVAVGVTLYGGFVWMTARGDDKKVAQGKKILTNGVIGLVIILTAWGIVRFIFGLFGIGTGGECEYCDTPGVTEVCWRDCGSGVSVSGIRICGADNCWESCSASCSGYTPLPPISAYSDFALQWKQPNDGQSNVSLCSMISARFSNNLENSTANKDRFSVYKCANEDCLYVDRVEIFGQEFIENKLITFYPDSDYDSLTWYKVVIDSSFTDNSGESLTGPIEWMFETGSGTDDTAPTVVDQYPTGVDICLASVVQAEFSEAMDPRTLEDLNNFELTSSGIIPLFSAYTPRNNFVTYTPQDLYSMNTDYTSRIFGSSINRRDWIDGGLDSSRGVRDVCGNPLASSYSWDFTTSENSDCAPEITSITTDTYHNDEIVIDGYYFTLGGEIKLNSNLITDNNCFANLGGYLYPNQNCLINWNSNQIRFKTPAGGGASNGPVDGPIEVVISDDTSDFDGLSARSFDDISILSPHIDVVSGYDNSTSVNLGEGARGGAGQIITLMGRNFGDSGRVYFIRTGDDLAIESGTLPAVCGTTAWSESQVAVVVPTGFNLDDDLKIQLVSDSVGSNIFQSSSNLMSFQFTNEVGPGVCGSSFECDDGNCGGISGDYFFDIPSDTGNVFGMGFGTTAEQLFFGVIETPFTTGPVGDDPASFGYVNWADEDIETYVPFNIIQGLNPIRVIKTIASVDVSSNAWSFKSPCDFRRCDNNPTTPVCDQTDSLCTSNEFCNDSCECQEAFRVINYKPSCLTACVNTAIEIRFSHQIDETSLAGNLAIEPSVSFATEYTYDDVTGDSILLIYPNSILNPDTEYRVVVADGLFSESGQSLKKLNYDSGSGNLDSYSWKFKTRNSSDICTADSANINGASQIAIEDSGNYNVSLGCSSNCNTPINSFVSGYNFFWSEVGDTLFSSIIPNDELACEVTADIVVGETELNVDISGSSSLSALKSIEIYDPSGTGGGVEGDPCGEGFCSGTGTCASGYFCAEDCTCHRGGGGTEGDPCGSAGGCLGDALCSAGYYCDGVDCLCHEDSGGDIGDDCGGVGTCAGTDTCRHDLYCREDDCTCQEGTSVIGDPCDGDSATPTCEATDGMCSGTLVCHPSTCTCQAPGTEPIPEDLEVTSVNTPRFCTNGLVELRFNQNIESFCEGIILTPGGWSYSKICRSNRMILNPTTDFEAGFSYSLDISDGVDPIGPSPINFSLSSSAGECNLSTIEAIPEEYNFNRRGQTADFTSQAYSSGGEAIEVLGADASEWNLVDIYPSINFSGENIFDTTSSTVTLAVSETNPENVSGLLQVSAIDIDADGDPITAFDDAEISLYLCEERGRFVPSGDSADEYYYQDDGVNFSLKFCQDSSLNYPETLKVSEGANLPDGDFLSDTHFIFTDESGVLNGSIGLLVFKNENYENLNTWFANKFGEFFTGNSVTVDGYPAIQEGRSTYVAAPNIVGSNKFINIYLLSYSENADSEIIDLYNEFLENWTFNTNLIGVPSFDKKIMARDVQRIFDLAYVRNLLENYKNENATYPTLDGLSYTEDIHRADGIFLVGETTSLWNSWESVLGAELATVNQNVSMPVDPINEIGVVEIEGTSCVNDLDCEFVSGYRPTCYNGVCIRLESGYSIENGWNAFDQAYACPDESYYYIYKFINPESYLLTANLEGDPSGWFGFSFFDFGDSGPCVNW